MRPHPSNRTEVPPGLPPSLFAQVIQPQHYKQQSLYEAHLEGQPSTPSYPYIPSQNDSAQLENLTRQLDSARQTASNLSKENAKLKNDFQNEQRRLFADNEKLKRSLVEAQTERENGQDALDKMLMDLMTTQQELEEKTLILAQKEADNSSAVLMKEKEDEWREKEQHMMSLLASKEMAVSQLETQQRESQQMMAQQTISQQEVEELRMSLAAKDDMISHMQATRHQYQELESKYNALAQKTQLLNELLAAKDARNTQISSKITTSKASPKDPSHQDPDNEVRRLIESQAAELEQSRPMLNFFKKNSEGLSREVKDLGAKVRELQDDLMSKDQEIEGFKARARGFGDREGSWGGR
ncbi:uncharacterized protein BP5553_06357 [Venustampulla echinocandica]|uniref:Uncharacterized protein n=1 Tax=Venustampulla echinocandica TaxID=2656787 RepID=A0A370TJQ0_9HELO|nr:uncharacterized protein BP5553_06357 [Venustampulla echinocandica]RDL35745.1 hypothetical protein BP5553_06357 [Venustampulla echinocandica]